MASITEPYTERHGLSPKHKRGSGFFFIIAIGLVVAGAGAAGLHYRYLLWDEPSPSDHTATETEPYVAPVTLTGADERVVDPDDKIGLLTEAETTTDAGAATPKAEKPKAIVHARPKAKAETKSDVKSDDPFAKPE